MKGSKRLTTDNEQPTTVKESSDELNPPEAVSATEIEPRRRRTLADFVALAIATCGVGYAPLAPGTLGSILAVVIYLALRETVIAVTISRVARRIDPQAILLAAECVVILVITLVGIWAASRVERLDRKKDPSKVVIDEVAGQLVALLPVPLWLLGNSRTTIILAFVLFRAFDIVKPFPIRRLEKLESGLGIMADDLAAGAYAAIIVSTFVAAGSMMGFY